MKESGLEIPMSQSGEGSTSASQPMYVGEDDVEWMRTFNHKKGRVPGFGKIQPCPSLSKRRTDYASTSSSGNVDQMASMRAEIMNEMRRELQMEREAMQKEMQMERETMQQVMQMEMREMMKSLMEGRHPSASTVCIQSIFFNTNFIFNIIF